MALHSSPDTALCSRCLDWLVMRRDRKRAARGGGWVARGHEPIFTVADVARSVDHYTKLGFDPSSDDENYAFARREPDLTIHLHRAEGDAVAGAGSLYLHVDDADRVAEEWRRAGLEVSGPEVCDWGTYEGRPTDPDGNLIRFGSRRRRPDPA